MGLVAGAYAKPFTAGTNSASFSNGLERVAKYVIELSPNCDQDWKQTPSQWLDKLSRIFLFVG